MKQQATTVINANRVNDAHTAQLDALQKEKQLYCRIYILKYVVYR